MMGKTHVKGGLIAGMAISYIGLKSIPELQSLSINTVVDTGLLISGSLVGSLLPDLDHPNSKAGRKLWLISGFVSLIHKISSKLKLKKLSKMSGHRGFLHSLFFWIPFTFLLMMIPNFIPVDKVSDLSIRIYQLFTIGVLLGAISHIILDMMTVSGVPILMPLSYKSKRIPLKIKTQSKQEKIFSTVLDFVIIGMMIISVKGII